MRRSHFTDGQKISALKRLESGERAAWRASQRGGNKTATFD